MNTIEKVFCLCLLLFSLVSCSSASFVRHDPTTYPPKPDDYFVPIISSYGPQLDPGYYMVIGTVEANKDAITVFDKVSLEGVFEMLKTKARQGGADALIQVRYQRGTATGRRVDSVYATGAAIVFKNREEALKKLKEMGAVFR